jgi:serine/threonine protein kinase
MEGNDLFDYLQDRNFSISERRAKEIALQIVQALRYLHNYGIVHRDLKLENIIMIDNSENAVPKIVDFGLAKVFGPS